MEAVTGAFVQKWFKCLFLLKQLFQDGFVWFQFFFSCTEVYFTWLSVFLLQCLFSLMWYTLFSPVFFSLLSGRDIHCLWGHPTELWVRQNGLGHFCCKALQGEAQRHRMARQSVSLAMLSGARWTHCKKMAGLASAFILCSDLKLY